MNQDTPKSTTPGPDGGAGTGKGHPPLTEEELENLMCLSSPKPQPTIATWGGGFHRPPSPTPVELLAARAAAELREARADNTALAAAAKRYREANVAALQAAAGRRRQANKPGASPMDMVKELSDARRALDAVLSASRPGQALLDRLARAEAVLELAPAAQREVTAIMRQHGLKIDNLDDPMQKLAFTIYTELVTLARAAEAALNGGVPGE